MIPDLRLLDASSPVLMPRRPHRPDGPGPAATSAGDYIVVESFGPAGYRPVSEFAITIPGGRTTQLNVVNDRN